MNKPAGSISFWRWVSIGILLLLIAGSVVGAFAGAERTKAWANSTAGAVVWGGTFFLMAPFLVLNRMRWTGGSLALHAGFVLVLLGGMLCSHPFHLFLDSLLNRFTAYDLSLQVYQGQIVQPAGVDFAVGLNDFRVEYYPATAEWELVLSVGNEEERSVAERWSVPALLERDAGFSLPVAGADLRVRDWLVWARESTSGTLLIDGGDRAAAVRLPAEEGASLYLEAQATTLTIGRVFQNLRVEQHWDQRRVVDLPEQGYNPALEMTLLSEGAHRPRQVYVFNPGVPVRAFSWLPGLRFLYQAGNAPLYGLLPPGVLCLELRDGAGKVVLRDLAAHLYGDGEMDLGFLYDSPHAWRRAGAPALHLLRPRQMPRDFLSDLSILQEGVVVQRETIEVNHPLHYGGYHLYQSAYDPEQHAYSVLKVRRDRGLGLVWAGFFMLFSGMVWQFWVVPLRIAVRGRHGH